MEGEQTKQGAGSGGAGRLAAVRARIDELGKLNQQLEAARTAAKRTRLGIGIVILLIILGFAWVWYSAVKSFDTPVFVAEIRTLMLNPKSGTMKEAIDTVERVLPVYQAEVKKQFAAEWPNIVKQLQAEQARIMKELPEEAKAKLVSRMKEIADAQQKVLLKEFPELKDDASQKIVLDNLQVALQDAILIVFQKRIEREQARLRAVHETILKILPADTAASFSERVTAAWDQFLLDDLKGRADINPQ